MDEMQRLTELGADLYPTEGPTARLRTRALATGRPRQARVRPVLVAAGIAVLAAGGVAVAAGTTGRTPAHVQPAAFAVEANADGSVTLTARDLVDPAAATKALNGAGIAGRVVNMTSGEDGQPPCASGPVNPADIDDTKPKQRTVLNAKGNGASVTVDASDYGPGGGLLIWVRVVGRRADGQVPVALAVSPYKDVNKIPSCVLVPNPPPSGAPS